MNILHFIVVSCILFTIHHNLMNEVSSLLCKINLSNFTLIWLCMQSFLILTIHYAMQNNFEILTLSLLNKMVILYVFCSHILCISQNEVQNFGLCCYVPAGCLDMANSRPRKGSVVQSDETGRNPEPWSWSSFKGRGHRLV